MGRPIFFATTIIVVAFVPLFTMTGVPGKIFAPMSLTYGLALTGRVTHGLYAGPCPLLISPYRSHSRAGHEGLEVIKRRYLAVLKWTLDHPVVVIGLAIVVLVVGLVPRAFSSAESSCRRWRKEYLGADDHAGRYFIRGG